MNYLGIDIGGTKIAAIAIDAKTGDTLREDRIDTPKNYEDLIKNLTHFIRGFIEKVGPLSVGICYPGATDEATGLVNNGNMVYLHGKPFEGDMIESIGQEIRYDNDANCFVLSEAIDGAGAGKPVVFGATLGTGLGGGIVVNQQRLKGLNKITGEWGHNPLPWPTPREIPGPQCFCGLRGCQETFLSGTGLARSYRHDTGKALRAEDVVKLAQSGDELAEAALMRFENRMARALAQVINLLDPDIIVLGGGLSSLERLYVNVPRQWDQYTYSKTPVITPLVQAKHGGTSGMRGAAYLWKGA